MRETIDEFESEICEKKFRKKIAFKGLCKEEAIKGHTNSFCASILKGDFFTLALRRS